MASKGGLNAKLLLAALGGAGLGSLTRVRPKASRGRTTYMTLKRRRYGGRKKMSKRRWQAKARRSVGVPRNYATSKTAVGFETNSEVVKNQIIFPVSLIRIAKGTGIDQRLRDTVVVSGVRIQFAWRNIDASSKFINWAVVHPKDEASISASQVDFFRDYGNNRAWNANAVSKTGLEWSHAALNPDKLDILRRGKFMIGGNTGTMSSSPLKDDIKEVDFYVKLGRSFMFDTEASGTEPYENIYFVYWQADPLASTGGNLGDGTVTSGKVITYFREPKSG